MRIVDARLNSFRQVRDFSRNTPRRFFLALAIVGAPYPPAFAGPMVWCNISKICRRVIGWRLKKARNIFVPSRLLRGRRFLFRRAEVSLTPGLRPNCYLQPMKPG